VGPSIISCVSSISFCAPAESPSSACGGVGLGIAVDVGFGVAVGFDVAVLSVPPDEASPFELFVV